MTAAYKIDYPEERRGGRPPRPVREKLPSDLRNGLLVRMPNHLGDAVMALPALQQLRSLLPLTMGLFVVVPKAQIALYHALHFVDEIIAIEAPHRFWSHEECRQIRQLRAGAAVLFNHSFRDALQLRLCGIPCLYGESGRCRSLLLTRSFPLPHRVPGDEKGSHQLYRYLAVSEALGAEPWNEVWPTLDFPVRSDEIKQPLSAFCNHTLLLVIAPGAAYGAAKRWPSEYFRSIADYWIRRGGVVAVVGSPQEAAIGDEVLKDLNSWKCMNFCGKTDLQSLLLLLRKSAMVLANDSGVMHLAALLQRPGIAVFGPTDATDTSPLFSRIILLKADYPCAPCLKRICPRATPAPCIRSVTPFAVLQVVRKMAKKYHWIWTKQLQRPASVSSKIPESKKVECI